MAIANTQVKRTVLNVFTGFFTLAIQTVISFFLSPYIVQTLGEAANGYTQLANNFITYASLITVAFNSMAGRFMSIAYQRREHDKFNSYYSSVFTCNICMILFFFVASVFLIANLEKVIVIDNAPVLDVKILFAFVFAGFLVNLLVSMYNTTFFVTNKLYLQNNISLFQNILNAVVLLLLFYLLPPKMYYVTGVSFVLTFLTVPIRAFLQKKNIPELKYNVKNFKISSIKELIMSGMWNTINQCGNLLMTGMDLLFCNLFINPVVMGVLAVAKSIPSQIFIIASTLNNSLSPSLTMVWASGDKKSLLSQLRYSMKFSSVIVSIPIMTFTLFSVPFYKLWMPTLDAKQLAILSFLTCMSMIPWAGPQALYNVFTATNKLRANSIVFVATGAINILLVFVLLKYTGLGVYAVAGVSSSLTIIKNLIFTVPYTAKILGFKWYTFYKDVIISIICCAINGVIAFFVNLFIKPQNWIMLIVAVLITCILTLIVEMFVILNKEERASFKNKFLRKKNNNEEG